MIEIEVATKFTLLREDGTSTLFLPGRHLVSAEDADHWYLKKHLRGAPPPEPKPGTPEFALRALEQANKARAVAEEAAKRLAEAEEAAQAAARAINTATAVVLPRKRLVANG